MAIYLVVGQPRHGKSQFCAKMAYEYEQNNIRVRKKIESGKKLDPEKDIIRNVFSDINGHVENCDFVQKAPDDWREAPENSVIFYDEIHLRPEYCDTTGKMSLNPMIVELTTHAHKNKDIVLITQDPARLNRGIHKLIEKMYLVKRPIQKPPFATIYEFERWLRDPWQASKNSNNYQDSYKFLYKKKWQDMYTSASAHTSINFKIQSKFIYAICAAALLMGGAYFLFTKSGGDKLAKKAVAGLSAQTSASEPVADPIQNQLAQNQQAKTFNPDVECRKGENVSKSECVAWFNDLSKNNKSVSADGSPVVKGVHYNPNRPYDDDSIVSSLTYEVTEKPVFSGCVKKNGRYIAYTQQGTILNEVSQSDCKKLIENGDRPFNYFKQQQQQTMIAQDNQKTIESDNEELTPEMIAKYNEAKRQGLI